MRIESLRLERYGAFESRSVDLSGPGLIVIYGPNEAGKSTCLSAIGDFFYTIPHNSPLGVFGYDAMRIGATLSTAGGKRLVLQRRKGRGRTLVDDAGIGQEDNVLTSLLGATDRDRFSELFGLDHERLRMGGERLLAADGEIGRLIVEAGGGLRHLMDRLDDLDAEAGRLFSVRRSVDRAFYKGLDAFTDADSRLRAASLSRETYEAARKTRDEAEEALEALRAEQRTLVTDASRLDRLIRVTPILNQLASVEASLEGFADVAGLAFDFHTRWEAARLSLHAVDAAFGQAKSAHDQLATRLETLEVDPRFAAAALDVEDLGQRIVLIAQQRRDRPNRQRDLQDDEAKLVTLRARLKAPDANALAERLPPEEAVDAIQRLALEATGREAATRQAQQRIAEVREAVATLNQAIVKRVAAGHDKHWGVEVGAFANLATQAAGIEARTRQLEIARVAIARDLTAVGFDDLDALRALPRPDPDTLRVEIGAREELETELTNQGATLARARVTRDGALADIERLRQGGEVATEAALEVARGARDTVWNSIRQTYREGAQKSDETRIAEADRMDAGLAEADDLADRRITEAQRVAALAEAEHRRSSAEAEILAAQAAVTSLSERLAARKEAFSSAFSGATARHPELSALLTFVTGCADLLARTAEAEREAADLARQQGEMQPLIDLLISGEELAGIAPDANAPFASRIQAFNARFAAHNRDQQDLSRKREDLERAEAELRSHERTFAMLAAEAAAWATAWSGPLAQLGAAPGTSAEAAAALANQWASARGVLGSLAQTRRRLERMDEDEAELASFVARLVEGLGLTVPPDALEAAGVIIAQWRTQDGIRSDRAALEPELATLRARLETATTALEASRAAMGALCAEANLTLGDFDALEASAERVHQRQALLEEERNLLDQLRTAGDGLDRDNLRAQQSERGADALKGDLAALQSRLVEVESEVEAAIRSAQAARLELDGYERGDDANRALADRESATAQMHAILERYVEVRLARELVAAAIARVRATQQDPLVRRAGALFEAMTQGRFSGVETDVDDKGVPVVVGRRAGGGVVSVSAMSDGARDQLFLAFRLASLEVYCRSAEPLPFIADDILVHFDDARSAATLELLAEFSGTTQVLLFTHHESVRDAATRMAGSGRATLVELGATE